MAAAMEMDREPKLEDYNGRVDIFREREYPMLKGLSENLPLAVLC